MTTPDKKNDRRRRGPRPTVTYLIRLHLLYHLWRRCAIYFRVRRVRRLADYLIDHGMEMSRHRLMQRYRRLIQFFQRLHIDHYGKLWPSDLGHLESLEGPEQKQELLDYVIRLQERLYELENSK